MLALFTLTIFLGATLVFGVQPIAARMLLPSFGGSPAVWSATSVFFQVALLAGYGYSYALTRWFAPRRQPLVHVIVLAAPLLFLPLGLPLATASEGVHPSLTVIGLLALGLGVPFTVAATTGPLIQRWFSFTGHRAGRDPYFLYAASNAGSLLVLLAYPFVIEPRLNLASQTATWSAAYLAFALLSVACAVVVVRTGADADESVRDIPDRAVAGPGWTTRARWILLAAVPSALSLGATAYISTDIAAVPLLWIIPLSLYLLSFIIAFSTRLNGVSRRAGRVLPWLAALLVIPSGGLLPLPVTVVIVLHLAFLFVAATMCHGRLAEERPPARHLTEFYLLLAIGGALGGIAVSIAAPVVFDRVWEYPIAIGLALLLRPGPLPRPTRRTLIGLAAIVLVGLLVAGVALRMPAAFPAFAAAIGIGVALLVILLAASSIRPLFAVMAVGILAVSVWGSGTAIHTDRTFFGVYRVTEDDGDHLLIHGSTIHGWQHLDDAMRLTATTYYHRSGPIGQVFAARGDRLDRVAILGLGVGTLATYSEPGQSFTFYEIDGAMVDIARDPRLFTFVGEARGSVDIVVADGRLGLVADPARYDLLVLDAFTSDAIPAHLLTREALEVYVDHLAADGIIAMNVTNRFLDLEPVVAAVADSLGLVALTQHDTAVTAVEADEGKSSSTWALLAREPDHLTDFAADPRWRAARLDPAVHAWTDDFSDILAVLR